MGGSAFSAILSPSAFPRIPPAVYRAVKARLTPQIQSLYAVVGVPHEAPEKDDHGDVDFLVCEPLVARSTVDVPHEEVMSVLCARHVVPMPGNRTSSYAVPITHGEWAALGCAPDEEARRRAAKDDEQEDIFYQVDVHVCSDRAEWERIFFFHGYGDLGMIMGLVARNQGLHLGEKGLKIPNPPRTPFDLTESMDVIMQYMGLSMEQWKAGFATKRQVFEWVGESPFFDPTRFRSEGQGFKKVKPERKMYAQFVEWAQGQKERVRDSDPTARGGMDKQERIQHALVYFHKKAEFDALARETADKALVKEGFNGVKVRLWTGLAVHQWKELKLIMDQVRGWVGGEQGILKTLGEEGEEGLEKLVLRAKDELKIVVEEPHEKAIEEAVKRLEAVVIAESETASSVS